MFSILRDVQVSMKTEVWHYYTYSQSPVSEGFKEVFKGEIEVSENQNIVSKSSSDN